MTLEFFVSTNCNGSLAITRGPRGRGVRRRGASSSSASGAAAAAETGAVTVSIKTNGSLGAVSRLRRRAGRGVDRVDTASSIWSTGAASLECTVSTAGDDAMDCAAVIGVGVAGFATSIALCIFESSSGAASSTLVCGAGADTWIDADSATAVRDELSSSNISGAVGTTRLPAGEPPMSVTVDAPFCSTRGSRPSRPPRPPRPRRRRPRPSPSSPDSTGLASSAALGCCC